MVNIILRVVANKYLMDEAKQQQAEIILIACRWLEALGETN